MTGEKVGVSREEKKLSYFRFYEQEMAPIPEEKLALADHPQKERYAVPFVMKNLFLKGEDTEYCQIGYGIADDGTGFVCNKTYMPGVTGQMLDFWFPWHSVGSDLRYKIWDPEDHYFARANRADYVCDPRIPVREKTWGVDHYILEDTGMGPEFLKLCFMSPTDFGYEASLIGTRNCESLVCAIGAGGCAAAMTHKWFPYQEGTMLVSRFWIGYALIDGEIRRSLPEGIQIPEIAARGLYMHNIKEFSNLAAILPAVYAENKDNF